MPYYPDARISLDTHQWLLRCPIANGPDYYWLTIQHDFTNDPSHYYSKLQTNNGKSMPRPPASV